MAVRCFCAGDVSVSGPSFMVGVWRHRMGRRGGRKDVSDQAFIVSLQFETDLPANVGRPMPVEDVLPAFGVPVPFHFSPYLVYLLRDLPFLFISIPVIFSHCQ